jgi:hypothetical protein
MKRTIHLDKEIFKKVKSGKKKFEIRLGNEEINEGDELTIIQRDSKGTPTKNRIIKKAGYIENTKKLNYWPDEKIKKFGFKIIQLE